jgi:hypothetical protein
MLQIQFIHLLYLIVLIGPGVIAGAIVTWKTRSAWSLFITIGFSLLSSIILAIVTVIFGKLATPLLSPWIGSFTALIDFSQTPTNYQSSWFGSLPFYLLSYLRYSIVAPIGTVLGATLAGMLMIVRYELISTGGRFDLNYAWIASFGSMIVGGVMSIFSILLLSWIGSQGLNIIQGITGSLGEGNAIFVQIFWGILISVNGLVCGVISSVFGMKLSKLLM